MARKVGGWAHNVKESLTGLRVVKMYFQEFFGWSYEEISQENDDGLDGLVFVRNKAGQDTGGRIYVQVKSGPSYGYFRKDGIISVNAYSGEEYKRHQRIYDSLQEPVILIYVDSRKTVNGKVIEDLYKPNAWWLQLNGYKNKDDACVYRIPPENTFGEHSMGVMKQLVGENNRKWQDYGYYTMTTEDKRLYNCLGDLRASARTVYQNWKNCVPFVKWQSFNGESVFVKEIPLIVSNTGWRHINNWRRGSGLIRTSLSLLSVAKNILSEPVTPIEIRRGFCGKNAKEIFYAVRKIVPINDEEEKVQIILRRWINPVKQNNERKDRLWFYSVHIIKD